MWSTEEVQGQLYIERASHKKRASDVAQWLDACLAWTRSWVWSFTLTSCAFSPDPHHKYKIKPMESRLCWLATVTREGFVQSVAILWKTVHCLSPSSRKRDVVPTLLCAEIMSSLSLCGSCACYHSLCEVIRASALLCLEDILSLKPSIASDSYNLSASSSM